MSIEERILLNEIQKHNRDVFELLFDQYYPRLVKFAEGYLFDISECEDVVQSFFINFWINSKKLKIETSLRLYFFTSIKNLCLNIIRDMKVKDKYEILYIESLINVNEGELFSDPEIFKQINNAIDSLPKQMAKIFKQKYYECKQIKEIAKELKITDGTVKTQLYRARISIREKLQKLTGCLFFL